MSALIKTICATLLVATGLSAAPKILYVTHSAGFRHGSIEVSREVLQSLAARTGQFEIVATEDLRDIAAGNLANYEAVFFFTSGELALSDEQKSALLNFVRSGKGFGGVHSATDTLYGWPEYGELIGGYFDGHPWTQEATVNVEEPEHPFVRHLGNSFRLTEEFYQFRAFSRDRVRVLLTLDPRSVDLTAPGVNRKDSDFALAWLRRYGNGRVFYSAFGHLDETWRDQRFQDVLHEALLWLTGQTEGEAAPRKSAPRVEKTDSLPGGFGNRVAPGALIGIGGSGLTNGSSARASSLPLPLALAGTSVQVNGTLIPLLSVTPDLIEAHVPPELSDSGPAEIVVTSGNVERSVGLAVEMHKAIPRIVAAVADRGAGWAAIYATGLGRVEPAVSPGIAAPSHPLSTTTTTPQVSVSGQSVRVLFSGLAPNLLGVYQVNAELPQSLPPGRLEISLEAEGQRSNTISIE